MFRTTLLSAAALFSVASVAPAQPTDIILGHYDILIDYNPTAGNPNAGWRFSVAYDEDGNFNDAVGIVRLNSADVRLVAAPTTQKSITSAVSQMGPIGAPLWLMPQNNELEKLFLGLRTIVPAGFFQATTNGVPFPDALGNFVLELVSIRGSGPAMGAKFANWESNGLGQLEFHFDTSDGINAQDRLEPVPAGAHTHYSWGMTHPGSYQLTFRAFGWINPWQPDGGQYTEGFGTYTFVVPFSCSARGSADLHLAGTGQDPAAIYHASEQCEHAPDRIALVTQATDNGGTPVAYGFRLNTVGNASAARNRIGLEGTEPLVLPSGFSLRSPGLKLIESAGPGNATLAETSPGETLFSFDQPGIYRLTLRALLSDEAAQAVEGEAFQLTFLAGIPVDYGYAIYADSFERQHSLPTGSLSDAFADFDGDTVPNGVEFQMFWHGFDPAVPDAHRTPLPTLENGAWGITFLRDTYKDDFSETGTRVSAAYSPDLQSWSRWHTRSANRNKPLDDAYEAGTGAASVGRIMERRVSARPGREAGFYRFELF